MVSICLKVSAGSVTFQITKIPDKPQNPLIFIAGSFNNWNPGDIEFKLHKTEAGYEIMLDFPKGDFVEYKFTQGSWNTVEKDADFAEIANRTHNVTDEDQTLNHTILNWRNDAASSSSHVATITGNVQLIKDFYMPQLDRKRNIRIYLPPDYAKTQKRYPVIYMHDGQNLFDESTSFSGEWKIDESLESLFNEGRFNGAVVVGIDNHPRKRSDELIPWNNPEYGGGKGDAYVDFITLTLKTWIDENYLTLTDAQNTAIAGSSLGGLISLYAGCKYPETYGKIGIFSPAFWVANPEIRQYVISHPLLRQTRVYIDVGTMEGNNAKQRKAYLKDAEAMNDLLAKTSTPKNNLKFIVDEGAKHHESFWAKRFPDAILWLFH